MSTRLKSPHYTTIERRLAALAPADASTYPTTAAEFYEAVNPPAPFPRDSTWLEQQAAHYRRRADPLLLDDQDANPYFPRSLLLTLYRYQYEALIPMTEREYTPSEAFKNFLHTRKVKLSLAKEEYEKKTDFWAGVKGLQWFCDKNNLQLTDLPTLGIELDPETADLVARAIAAEAAYNERIASLFVQP